LFSVIGAPFSVYQLYDAVVNGDTSSLLGVLQYAVSLPVVVLLFTRDASDWFKANRRNGDWSVGAVVAITLAVLVLPFFLAGLLVPALASAREKARRAACSNNVKEIILGLKIYASDHGEEYPPSLQDISPYLPSIEGNSLSNSSTVFVCPSSDADTGSMESTNVHSAYLYVSGLTEGDPANTAVVVENPENHRGEGGNVGFIDGAVKWCSVSEIKSLLAEPWGCQTPPLSNGQARDLKRRIRVIRANERNTKIVAVKVSGASGDPDVQKQAVASQSEMPSTPQMESHPLNNMRIWTGQNGAVVEAKLVSVSDDGTTVTLRTRDEQIKEGLISRLSEDDQAYIRTHIRAGTSAAETTQN